MAAIATFALKPGVWFRRVRLVIVSPDSQRTACLLSGRNSTYRPVQISGTGSFLVLTTPFSFDREFAQCSRNYFSDPDEWCALFKVSGDDGKGLWRVVFPTQVDETDDQATSEEAAQRRL